MNDKCDRCGEETTCTQMSLFNTDMCCSKCLKTERAHPEFPKARACELDELLKGNYNFPGIGLPKDLELRRGVE